MALNNINVLDYDFINANTDVFVVMKRDSAAAEYKRELFAKYQIEKDTLI